VFPGSQWRCQTVLSESHTRTIRCVAWSPDGQYLASSSFDATTCVWNRKSSSSKDTSSSSQEEWTCDVNLEGHENEVKCVAWSPSGKYLATCSRDKTVWIWEMLGGEELDFECASVQTVHSQDVKKVIWHPHDDILVSCSYDNTIKMYREDGDDWTCYQSLESHESTVWSIAFNSTGNLLASCSDDQTIKIWKSMDGKDNWKCLATLSGYHKRAIYDISWCPLTNCIASSGGDDTICVFRQDNDGRNELGDASLPNFSLITKITSAHDTDVNCVDWNPSIKGLLASGGDDELVKLWQLNLDA